MGLNEVKIKKYIHDQEKCYIMQDNLKEEEYEELFKCYSYDI